VLHGIAYGEAPRLEEIDTVYEARGFDQAARNGGRHEAIARRSNFQTGVCKNLSEPVE
jgi:hypothetical protein